MVLLAFIAALGVSFLRARPSAAQPGSLVKTVAFQGARFDVVELPLEAWDVRITWAKGGTRLADVEGSVRTNAGIFEPGFTPTGLLVSSGSEFRPLDLRQGEGNFYLLPNGVFTVGGRAAQVLEAREYDGGLGGDATQSGPLLVRGGELHPRFNRASENRALRSGVGVRGRTVVLAISRDDVNLWTFATLFRDELKCPDALYLDGVISALWAADAGREADLQKGPFAGVITAIPRLPGAGP